MKKAIIFDMDGVIVASEEAKFKFLQKTFKKLGIELKDDSFSKVVGRTAKNFLTETLTDQEKIDTILDMFKKQYLDKIIDHVSPIKSTVAFIKSYKGSKKMAIASSGYQKVNETIAHKFGITPFLETIISREMATELKPHPAIYLKAVEALKLNPKDCVAIEDSITGIQAAIAAGIDCYVFLNPYSKREDFKGLKIAGFIENEKDYNKLI